ncbi:MAG: alkaline phosphatase [Spirochaetales bacterium]|nr:alkaline phosphatase [Spirochaetales bacterium]
MKKILSILIILVFCTGFIFAAGEKEKEQKTGPVYNSYSGTKAKYIFCFIGDGMGISQVGAAEAYLTALKNDKPDSERELSFTKFPAQGITTTFDLTSIIPDSASTATAIATGNKTASGVISMDETKTKKFKSIAIMAKEAGMKVGIVSSVSIDHATPATFYSHEPSRKNMYEIALQLANSPFDYFGGGDVVDPDGIKSTMENKPGNVYEIAEKNGFKITRTKEEFNNLKPGDGKVWAITDSPADANSMLYDMDRGNTLSLEDFTQKGIELLDNSKGFFLAVEAGKIDWACHANDAVASINDTIAFDNAIKAALTFAEKHTGETLIIVTGDHETGGLALGYAGTGYTAALKILEHQKISYVKFDELFNEFKTDNPQGTLESFIPVIANSFGFTINDETSPLNLSPYEQELIKKAFDLSMQPAEERTLTEGDKIAYGYYNPISVTLTHILNNKAGLAWTTYSHSGVPVPTYAYGVGQDLFDGYYDDTDIFKKMTAIMGVVAKN